jgi:flagellar motility protein MotE (MotC chaperone)
MTGRVVPVRRPSLGNRIGWVFLVIVVPVIAAVGMIAVALSIVGIPVWSMVMHTFGAKTGTDVSKPKTPSAVSIAEHQLRQEQTKNAQLSQQLQQVQAKVQSENTTILSLKDEIKQLHSQLSNAVAQATKYKREASYLTSMDAGQAAQVLAKLSLKEAAAVVGQMSSSDASGILGAMDPALASKIVSLAAAEPTSTSSSNGVLPPSSGSGQ